MEKRNRAELASNDQRAAERDQQRIAKRNHRKKQENVAQPASGGSFTRSEQMMVEEMGLTADELAMINKIRDPHQRGMQIMQMYMQHKRMLETGLSDLATMRREFLRRSTDPPEPDPE